MSLSLHVRAGKKRLSEEKDYPSQISSTFSFKMFVFSCVVTLTMLSASVSDASSNQNQFWCGLAAVNRCVSNANNLTECNCTQPNQRYCPFNETCLPIGSYNESVCWENASCPIVSSTPTITVSSATGSYVINAPTLATTANIFATGSIDASQSTSVLPNSSVNHVPTMTTKPTTFFSLNTDYTPIIIAVAAGFGGFVVFVCCMCVVHSWWLQRNKFTGVNSTPLSEIEKRRRKQERREARLRPNAEEPEKKTSKFDMGYREPQKVNERALANYDWARTSYLPGMLEPTVHEPHPAGSIPKLICDDDDDSELDGDPNELGDDNIAFEYGNDDQRKVASPSISSLEEIEPQPQEPAVVEPEIFESMEEIPRPPPDGDMPDAEPTPPSQDYFQMMGRF